MNIRRSVPLSGLSTFRVGGPAFAYTEVASAEDVLEAALWARENNIPLIPLGSGSNIVVADEGLRALVIRYTAGDLGMRDGLVYADAGCSWDDVVQFSVSRNLAGIECLSGIPGTAGAAPIQNIGAYGQEVGTVLNHVEVVDLQTGSTDRLPAASCNFGYRTSIFHSPPSLRYIVTRVVLRLLPDTPVTDVRAHILRTRDGKGMLLGSTRSYQCAGSFFKNPIVPLGRAPNDARSWPQPDSMTKLSAAWLIEHAGMAKGTRTGNVGLSPHHALCLINAGGASAAELLAFARSVQQRVFDTFGIMLEPEVRLWGFDEYPLMR